jgi:DNA-binding transcriptional LysR family regulator
MFNWDDLKHFLAFARTGSILAAAKAQAVNQSTVHRRLAELEARLSRRLIERHLTGYRLTELGAELLPFAERIEEAVTAFERHLASSDKELTGVVRVACSPRVGERLKRTLLLDVFHARFPALRVELMLSDRFVDLSKQEADIALRSQGPELEDETLIGRKIAEGDWGVYASRTYVERHGAPVRPEDIADHSVVECTGVIVDHSAARWLRAVAPRASVAAHSDSWAGLLLAVKSGAGIAPMPYVIGDRESELVRVIDHIPELVSHFYLLVHHDMQRTPRVRAFLDFVVSEIKAFREVLSGQSQGTTRKAQSDESEGGEGTTGS